MKNIYCNLLLCIVVTDHVRVSMNKIALQIVMLILCLFLVMTQFHAPVFTFPDLDQFIESSAQFKKSIRRIRQKYLPWFGVGASIPTGGNSIISSKLMKSSD